MASKLLLPLLHHHIHNTPSYHALSALQNTIVRSLLDHKASPSTTAIPPPARILTFSPPPIYTLGRRDLNKEVTPSQRAQLTAPLSVKDENGVRKEVVAEVFQAQRGGQITFHGPGQLVVYSVLDLKTLGLSPRCYVNRLEGATIRTLRAYGIEGRRTDDPGVWVSRTIGEDGTASGEGNGAAASGSRPLKIAALGVHLRRNVTSHGVALNVNTDLRWFDRIVACGLEGKGVSSMRAEHEMQQNEGNSQSYEGRGGSSGGRRSGVLDIREVADTWVRAFAEEVGIAPEGIVTEEMELPAVHAGVRG